MREIKAFFLQKKSNQPGEGHENDEASVDEMNARDEGEEVEPEPEEEVNLLVYDVEGENTKRVELLLPCRRAHAVKGAAGKKEYHI